MNIILIILLILLFFFLVFYKNDKEDFACKIDDKPKSCSTLVCNSSQVKAKIVGDPVNCRCCDIDFIDETNEKIKLYYNFDIVTVKDKSLRNMSINTDLSSNTQINAANYRYYKFESKGLRGPNSTNPQLGDLILSYDNIPVDATVISRFGNKTLLDFKNKKVQKIRFEGNDWLQLAQVLVYDNNSNKVTSNNFTINATPPGYNTSISTPIDGVDAPRNYPSIYHSNTPTNAYWEMVFKNSINLKEIVIHTRLDCCLDRIGNFNLLIFLDDNSTVIQKLSSSYSQNILNSNITTIINAHILDCGVQKPINQYSIKTASINNQNDVISWSLLGSNDKINWDLLASENNIEIPLDRNTIIPSFRIGYSLMFDATLSNLNMITTDGLLGPNSAKFINKNAKNQNVCTDYITINGIEFDNNKFTIAMWLSKDQIDTNNLKHKKYILQFQNLSKTVSINIYIYQNIIYVNLNLSGGDITFPINDTISYINSWFHFVWTFDGKDWYIYLNGNQIKYPRVGSFLDNEIFVYNIIGCSLDLNKDNCFTGKIDDFKLYNSYFSSEMVDVLYAVGSKYIKPLPKPSIDIETSNFMTQVNSSILLKVNTSGQNGFTSKNSISGPIMLTIHPPPINCSVGFSENRFEDFGVVYGFKTINEGGYCVIPIAPGYNDQPRIRPKTGAIVENDQTVNLKLIIDGENIKYLINDTVICIRSRINKLPLYLVGNLIIEGQFIYKMDLTDKIPVETTKLDDLMLLSLNKDPTLVYNMQFLNTDFYEIDPFKNIDFTKNKLTKKIRIDGVRNWLQIAQLTIYDINNNKIIYDNKVDQVNATEPWSGTNKLIPLDGNDTPRNHPYIYHSGRMEEPFWEIIYGTAKKIKSITVHTRSDCCTERITSFSLKLFLDDNTIVSTQLPNNLSTTYYYANNSFVQGEISKCIKNYSKSNLLVKICGPITPVKEDDIYTLRLSNIKNLINQLDQHLELSPFNFTDNGLTFSYWFKGTNSDQWSRIFDFGNGPDRNNILMAINSSQNHLHFGTWGERSNNTNNLLMFKNYNFEWIHVAWVLSKSLKTFYLYLNGSAIFTIPNANYPTIVNRVNMYIGKSNWNHDSNLNGFLTDFRIYNRDLNSKEVFVLYSTHPLKKRLEFIKKMDSEEIITYDYSLIKNPQTIIDNITKKSLVTLSIDKNKIINLNPLNVTSNGIINFKNYNGLDYANIKGINYNDCIIIPNINLSPNGLTFSFWIKPLQLLTGTRIFDFGKGTNNYNITCYISSVSELTFAILGEPTVSTQIFEIGDLTVWNHITWTISTSSIWSVYKNGILIKSINGGYPSVTLRNFNFIGKSNFPENVLLNYSGYIDDFRLYYRQLSTNEIYTLSTKQNLTELNNDYALVLYYDFETLNENKIINRGNNEGVLTFYFNNEAQPLKSVYNIKNQGTQNTKISLNTPDNNFQSMIINKNQKIVGCNSLYFNKSNKDFISFNPFQTELTGITISFWFKSINSDTWARMIDFGNGPGSDNILVCVHNNYLCCSVFNSRGGSNYHNFYKNPNPVTNNSTDVNINDNLWRHFTWLIEPYGDGVYANWYIYINGELLLPTPNTSITRTNTNYPRNIIRKNIYIGKSNWNDPFYNGCIEDFRFYNRMLSLNEIKSIYTINISENLNTDSKLVFSTNLIQGFKTITDFPSYCFNDSLKQHLQIDSITTDTNGISISFWIILRNTKELGKIFDFGSNLICEYSFGYLYFYINQNKTKNRLISDIKLSNNMWYHVTWTINQDKISKFYLNGKLKSVISSVYPLNITRNNNFIGKGLSVNDICFDGFISEFYVIDKELTDVEVNNIFQLKKHTTSVLVYINGDPQFVSTPQIPLNKAIITNYPLQYDPTPLIKNENINIPVLDINSVNFQNNDFVELRSFICDQDNIYNGYTFSFWFKSRNSNTWARFFDFGNGSANNNIIAGINNNYLFCSVFNNNRDSNYFNFYKINNRDVNINDDNWRHFVWTIVPRSQTDKSNASWYIYIDGVLMKPDPNVNATRLNTIYPNNIERKYNYLGKSNWNDPFLLGSIDDFRMYNRILSYEEIISLFNYNSNFSQVNNKLIIKYPVISENKFDKKFLKFSHTIFNYLNVSSFTLENKPLSISFWFKTISLNSPLFEFSNSDQRIYGYLINGNIKIEHKSISIGEEQNSIITNKKLNNNEWTHFTWNIDPTSKWDIYINNEKTNFNNYIELSNTFNTNQIGKISNIFTNKTFTGSMSEFRVFNKKLTDNEVSSMYLKQTTLNNDANQILYIPFEERKIERTIVSGLALDATLSSLGNITKKDKAIGESSLLLNDIIEKTYLTIDKFKINDNGFTIAFWYNFELLNNDNAKLIDFNNSSNYFKIYITQNFVFNIDVTVNNIIKKNSINLKNYVNNWFHFALVITKSTYNCYLNGQYFTVFTDVIYPVINNDTINYIGRGTQIPNTVVRIPDINIGTNYIVPLNNSWEYYNVQWTGYFYTNTTKPGNSVWSFFTNSDDASYLWIGNNAYSGYTIENATVKNGGAHPMVRKQGDVTLSPNTYYYIRIVFGERWGGDNMIVSFIPPGQTEEFNGYGYFFNDGKLNRSITLNEVDKNSGLSFTIYKGAYWEDNGGMNYFKNSSQIGVGDDAINCNISDFRICNDILSGDEIIALYLDKMNKIITNSKENECKTINELDNDDSLLLNFDFADDNIYGNSVKNNIKLKPKDINPKNIVLYDSLVGNYLNIFNNLLNIDPFQITNNHITITFWYKTTQYYENFGVHDIYSFANQNLIYGLRMQSNTLILKHQNLDYNTQINYLTNNQWYLITIVYKTTKKIKIYIDNKLSWTNYNLQFFGLGLTNNAYLGNGKIESGIANFRLYNRELKINEIDILYKNKYVINSFKLINYYRFENEFNNSYIKNEVTGNYDALASDINLLTTKAKKEGLYGALFDINKNNFVSLPNIIIKKSGICISLWYKQLSYVNNSKIFEFVNYSATNINLSNLLMEFNLVTLNSKFMVNLSLKGKLKLTNTLDSFFTVTNNIWYLLTVVFESNGICSLYINDKLQSKANLKFYPDEQMFYGTIARNIVGDFNYSKIDEFKIYENIITYEEIIKNYNIKAKKSISQYIADLNNDTSLSLFYSFKDKFINTQTIKFKNNSITDTKVYNILSKKFDVNIGSNFIGKNNPLFGSGYLTLFGNDDNSMVQYPSLTGFTSDINGFSISLWFRSKMRTNNQAYTRLLQLKNSSINDFILVCTRNNTLCVSLYNTTVNLVTSENFSNIKVNDYEWHHVVWNISTDGIWSVYLDNIQILNQYNRPYPKPIFRNENYIGRSDLVSEMFVGDIDEVRIFNRIIDEEEINALYNIDTININTFYESINISNLNNISLYNSQPAYNLITPKNISSVISWYDPNDIVVDNNNEVTNWNNQISNSLNLESKTGSIKPIIYSSNLQMINFRTNKSFIKTSTATRIAGFACVINIKNVGNNVLDVIFSSIKNEFTFRRGRIYQNYGVDQTDIMNGKGGVISINGNDVFSYPSFNTSYDNTNNFIVLYVKFGQYFNNSFTYDNDIIYQLSSVNGGFVGFMGDFICFNKYHNYYDQKIIEGYLSWKYGLQNKLPEDHPYSSAPPINTIIPLPKYVLSDPTKIQNIVAWYDPNNVVVENNIVKSWINQITSNSQLNLVSIGNISSINYTEKLKLISINNNTSYLTTNNNSALMNGFICVVYLTNTNNNDILFGSSLIGTSNTSHFFKRSRVNGNDNDDVFKGTNGNISINGKTYFDNLKINLPYNNTNDYVIIYVRYGIGTHGYDLTKQVNLLISNITNGIVGYIGDFICFGPMHTKRDQQKAEGYLAWKYSLQRYLPNNHPYKTLAPILPVGEPPIPLPTNDGSSYYLPNISGTKLKENYPNLPSGYYWIQTSNMTEPDRIYVDMVTDGGGWMLMYEVINPTRNNNIINYSVNKLYTLGSTQPQRIAYYMQNGKNPNNFAWASFNSWKDITNYDVPTGDSESNVFINQRDINNLNVISNVDTIFKGKENVIDLGNSVKQISGLKGRLEIWPSNYDPRKNTALSGGNDANYDTNDSGFNISIGYGSFQVNDITNNQTIFAWNRHSDSRPDIGFGNNPSGNPDWTFKQTDPVDFKLQIFIKIDIPIPPQPTEINDGLTILKPNISSLKIKQLPNLNSGYYYIQGPLAEFPSYVYVDSTTNKDLIDPLTIKNILAWYDPNNIELAGNFVYRWLNKVNKPSNIPVKSTTNTLVTKVRIECNANDWLNFSQIVLHDQSNNIIPAININSTATDYGTDKNTPVDNNIKARPYQIENKYTIYHSIGNTCPFWEMIINPSDIKSITIYNRTDCCNERLANFKLTLYSSTNTSITSINLNTEFVQRYTYINSILYPTEENLNLIPSGNITINNYLPNYNLINFDFSLTPNGSKIADTFLTSGSSKDFINAFVCLVKFSNNNNSFDMLFAPQLQNSDYSFRRGRFSSGIDGNDLHNGSEGLVYVNGNKVFDFDNKLTNISYNYTDNYAILYVRFGKNIHGYDKNTTKLEVQISSFFLNRGIIGNIGDFFCLSSNHTQLDRQILEGYIAWKWELQRLLISTHIYKFKLPSSTVPLSLPTNDGSNYNTPNVSSDKLKQNFASLKSGYYWIKTKDMYEPDNVFIDMNTDSGGWTLAYETTTYKRINNIIPYTVNKSNSIGLTKPTRIAYRIENDNNFVWVSFDAWSLMSSYDVPTGDDTSNVFTIQRDVTNMNIISNSPNVINASGVKGRLQIWPSNYGEGINTLLAGGIHTKYDCNNNSYNTSINHGAFQVFNINDINKPLTIFGWNHQRNDGGFEFGFGNNPNGHLDWTDSNSIPNNFKLQIFVKFEPINYTLPQPDLQFSGYKNVSVDTNNNVISWSDSNIQTTKFVSNNTRMPKLINNYIDFIVNNNQSILTTNLDSIFTQNITVYIAFNLSNIQNRLSQIFSSSGTWERGCLYLLLNGNKLQVSVNIGGNNDWITPFTIMNNVDYVFTFAIDNTTGCKATCTLNNSISYLRQFTNINTPIPIKSNQFEIGNLSGENRVLPGKIGEVIVFNRLLNAIENDQVSTYMLNKYLPSTIGQSRIIN